MEPMKMNLHTQQENTGLINRQCPLLYIEMVAWLENRYSSSINQVMFSVEVLKIENQKSPLKNIKQQDKSKPMLYD